MNKAVAQIVLVSVTVLGLMVAYQVASERLRQLTWNSAVAGLIAGLVFMWLLDLASATNDKHSSLQLTPSVTVDREMLATELASVEIRLFDSVATDPAIGVVLRDGNPSRALAEVKSQIDDAVRKLAYHVGILTPDSKASTRELIDKLIASRIINFALAKPLNEVMSLSERVCYGHKINDFDAVALVRAGRRITMIFERLAKR